MRWNRKGNDATLSRCSTMLFIYARLTLISLDTSSAARQAKLQPSIYLKQLWYDSVNGSAAALRCARDAFGADRLLLGTDYPHLTADQFKQCVSYVEESDLPPEEKRAILDRNAQTLLGLPDR